MASAGIGSLVVSLGLNAAEFTSGLTKSEQQAKRWGESLDRNIATAINGAAIATTALIASVGLAAAAFQTLVKGAADFQDLSDKTGAAAVDIASLAVSAATAGVSIEDVAGSINKLTKNLVGVDDEGKAAGAALAALGISVADFKKLDPVAQYEAIGKALGNYADGAGKVAIAQALFGKSGAEQLRVFKALEEAGGRQVILTAQQIALADEYADRQAKSRAQLLLYAQAAATEALPALTALTKTAVDFAKELLGVDSATKNLSANNGIAQFAESAAEGLAELIDKFAKLGGAIRVAVAISDLGGPRALFTGGIFSAEARKRVTEALDDYQKIKDRIDSGEGAAAKFRRNLAEGKAAAQAVAPAKPKLDFNFDAGNAAKAAAEQKKLLDGQIESIREYAEQQRNYLEFANRYAQASYDEGLTSLATYFATQRDLREAALQATVAGLDKEKAALEAALPRVKSAERIDLENKIAKVVAKRGEAAQKAAQDGSLAAKQEALRIKELSERYDELRASILQLSGDTVGASAIRIAKQVTDAKKLLAEQGRGPAEADNFGALLTQTESLAEAQRQYGRLVDRARDSEEALMLAATASGATELETLRAVGLARSKTLQDMSAMVDKANELALTLGTPDAIRFAEQLSLAFKRASAEADPLLLKFRDVGAEAGQAIAGGFEDAILAGDSFAATLKNIDKQLAKIALNELFTKPLQQYLSGAIGGNGQASGGGGLIGALVGGIGKFFGGGQASGGSSVDYNSLAALDGMRAIGGPTKPYGMYRVNERGPEVWDDGSNQYLMTGNKRGRVIPNSQAGGRTMNYSPTFVVQGAVDLRTQSQVFARAAQGVATANARNN